MSTLFDLPDAIRLEPRYNIAPTQPVAAVVFNHDLKIRQFVHLLWGLIPSWAKDPSIGSRMINARSETASSKPSFRNAFKRRRCLIPATGFFEWQKPQNKGAKKQPFYITSKDGQLLAFAGLWEHWQSDDGSELDSCAILTTDANKTMQPIHDRMPVILPPSDFETWLTTPEQEAKSLQPMLRPCDDALLEAFAVSTHVNSPRNDDSSCLTPVATNVDLDTGELKEDDGLLFE